MVLKDACATGPVPGPVRSRCGATCRCTLGDRYLADWNVTRDYSTIAWTSRLFHVRVHYADGRTGSRAIAGQDKNKEPSTRKALLLKYIPSETSYRSANFDTFDFNSISFTKLNTMFARGLGQWNCLKRTEANNRSA